MGNGRLGNGEITPLEKEREFGYNAAKIPMVDLLLISKQKSEALQLLRIILTHEAYIEQNYGIMNPYINEVLTGATNQQTCRESVEAKLVQLEG